MSGGKCGRFSEEYPKCGRFWRYAANLSQMLETHDQYWGIGIYGLGCNANFFYIDLSYCKERQYFVISFIADIRIFIIAYFVLHCPPHSMLHILFFEAATGNYSLK